jgi:Tfp pilus assembly protein PilN
MRNLLTDNFKKTLRQEYLLRVLTVSLWLITGGFLIGALSLAPSFILIQSSHRTLQEQFTVLQSRVASKSDETASTPVALLEQKLALLSKEREKERLTEALLFVLQARGDAGVTFTSFSYTTASSGKNAGQSELTLRGVAVSREALLSLKRALEADKRFKRVDLPVSNLAKERDIAFDIKLSGTF